MNEKHSLDAPDDANLTGIEQLSDHSNLSALYPQPHGKLGTDGILSKSERSRRRDEERDNLTLSIRPWFPVIGLLIPVPLILAVLIIAVGSTYVTKDTAMIAFMGSIVAFGIWTYLTFLITRLIYKIFYDHTLIATPFLMIFILFLAMTTQLIYVASKPLLSTSLIQNTIIIGSLALVASIGLSGILLPAWSSVALSNNQKTVIIGLVGVLLAIAAASVTLASSLF